MKCCNVFVFYQVVTGQKESQKAYKKEIKLQKQKRQKVDQRKKSLFLYLMCQIFVNFDFYCTCTPFNI